MKEEKYERLPNRQLNSTSFEEDMQEDTTSIGDEETLKFSEKDFEERKNLGHYKVLLEHKEQILITLGPD